MLKNPDHMLVPLDGSPLAECVLPHVVALSRIFGSPILLLRVVEQEPETSASRAVDPLSWQIRKTEADAYLSNAAERLRALDLNVTTEVVEGQPAERIVHYANEREVSLVVLSSHGRGGLSPWNINSVVQKVLLRVYAPVLIVRAYHAEETALDATRYDRVLVPLDGSQRAESALSLATMIAQGHDAVLLAAHVVHRPEVPRRRPLSDTERELVAELVELNREEGGRYLEDLKGRLPCQVETRLLVADNPTAALEQMVQSEGVDMTLISAHGYSCEARWPYGGVALSFIVYGTTPLLVVQDLTEEDRVRSAAAEAAAETKGH